MKKKKHLTTKHTHNGRKKKIAEPLIDRYTGTVLNGGWRGASATITNKNDYAVCRYRMWSDGTLTIDR